MNITKVLIELLFIITTFIWYINTYTYINIIGTKWVKAIKI